MVQKRLIKQSSGDRIFLAVVYVSLSLALVLVLYPLLYVVSASFSSPAAIRAGKVWLLPKDVTLMGYEAVFRNQQIVTGFVNSIFYTVVGTVVNIIMTMLCAISLYDEKNFAGAAFYRRSFSSPCISEAAWFLHIFC